MDTEFGTDIETALTECEVIRVREDGQVEESLDHVPPSAFVMFQNRDEEYDHEDIQLDGYREEWELIELRGDGTYRDGVYGPVSQVHTVHPDMVDHIRSHHGVYALITVDGNFPEWVFGASDRAVGTVLAKLVPA